MSYLDIFSTSLYHSFIRAGPGSQLVNLLFQYYAANAWPAGHLTSSMWRIVYITPFTVGQSLETKLLCKLCQK